MPQTIPILYQDKHLLVCVKPVGLACEEDGLGAALTAQTGLRTFCVHRLDRDVGGVMVWALNGKAAAELSAQFASRQTRKEYLAVTEAAPQPPEGILKDLLFHDTRSNKTFVVDKLRRGVKEAELEYSTAAAHEGLALLRIVLHTGRSHQIRVQFASRKMPLYGDSRYGSLHRGQPMGLWSHCLTFAHPVTHQPMTFTEEPQGEPWSLFAVQQEDQPE